MFSRSLIRTMSDSLYKQIPIVDIDSDGVFKYILIKLTARLKNGDAGTYEIVRGYSDCPFHADIEDKLTEQLNKWKAQGIVTKWSTKVLGGGRIDMNPDEHTIKVYGYSQGFGMADHSIAARLLKSSYTDYQITTSNEGY